MKIKNLLLLLFISFSILSCFDDQDDVVAEASNVEIGDFIWKAMNAGYLYQGEVNDLADDRFSTQDELNNHIASFSNPESFFESLIYNRSTVDKYSWIVSDYEALEAAFAGVNKTNGMSFGFFVDPDPASNKAYGYVRYVNAGTDASSKGIERGNIFNTVNGVEITYTSSGGNNVLDSGIVSAINSDSYEIGLATYDGTTVTPTGSSVTLVKSEQTINPVHTVEVITDGMHKIGYLMYNSFTADFDEQLNNAFATFSAENVTDLVIDLRYNSGGSVFSAITMASLATGQFNGQIFSTEQWNDKQQPNFSADQLTNRFVNQTRNGTSLNSLNLSTVYVLTSGRSASASELVIAGLQPYVDVVQIGTTTEGKFQASITLYDSPNLGRDNANPNHKYAIQPLVLKSINSVGFTDYSNGLSPDAVNDLAEDFSNLGTLGDENEPLFARAIALITGSGRLSAPVRKIPVINMQEFRFDNEMYIDNKELDLFW